MKSEDLLRNRFTRIDHVIQLIEEKEKDYATEVHKVFDQLDMNAIEKLALKRQKKLKLKDQLRHFVAEYQHKKW